MTTFPNAHPIAMAGAPQTAIYASLDRDRPRTDETGRRPPMRHRPRRIVRIAGQQEDSTSLPMLVELFNLPKLILDDAEPIHVAIGLEPKAAPYQPSRLS